MNILFVHQNYPGQYRESMPRLAATGEHKIVFLTQRKDSPKPADHTVGVYKPAHEPKPDTWAFSKWFETTVGNGVGCAQACNSLKKQGFKPDIITGHASWGELIYTKDVWPDVPLVGYFEYYFIPKGGLVGYDPEYPEKPDIAPRLHTNNAANFLTYVRCESALTASQWQKSVFPAMLHDKMDVCHEGIRTERLLPDHDSNGSLTFGKTILRRGDEIVTYIARNLEPARGFHTMMRSLPRLQALRPKAHVAIIGSDGISYGAKLPDGQTFRGLLTKEMGDSVDWSRVHFLGRLPYSQLIALLKLSNCHVYLTAPFVISWSMMESMALEKTIVATDVDPVKEVLEDGRTAFLTSYFKPLDLAERIADVLAHPDNYRSIGQAARRKVVADYDFLSKCFPQFIGLLNKHLPSTNQIRIP